jgi:glutathione S-transferase
MSSQAINYLDFEQTKQQSGLRMVVVKGLPSPWGEAAKGILHVKQLDWSACYHDPRSRDMSAWTGSRSAPVAIYNDEAPVESWLDILLLAERLAPQPALLPQDPEQRALALSLCKDLCGEMGLGWTRRLDGVQKGLNGKSLTEGGYPEPIAQYLAHKYGYEVDKGPDYSKLTITLLNALNRRLKDQREAGQAYYLGDSISAVDIYSAAFMAYFKPLSAEHCPMHEPMRSVFEALDEETQAALDPILLEHRDFIYSQHLALPLSL